MSTFVYVSNAEDGDIRIYSLEADGALTEKGTVRADKGVMPMAVSPDRRFLVAAVRGDTSCAHSYRIDPAGGGLEPIGGAPLAANCPYLHFDRSGRFLLGASYSAHRVIVHAFGRDGVVGETLQVVPTARNAHAVRTDETNRFVFVPHLGTDQIFQFRLDAERGRLAANTPPLVQLTAGSGPRHLITTSDNRFVYVLCELTGSVVTLALDAGTGLLTEVATVSSLPPDSTLVPGKPRGTIGGAGSGEPRDVSNDVWASDIHATADGRFIYTAERTRSTISWLATDTATGKLTWGGSVTTEKQPRGFAIDPAGRFLVASGEQSDRLSSYAIDATSGALRLVGRFPSGRGANWVEILDLGSDD